MGGSRSAVYFSPPAERVYLAAHVIGVQARCEGPIGTHPAVLAVTRDESVDAPNVGIPAAEAHNCTVKERDLQPPWLTGDER